MEKTEVSAFLCAQTAIICSQFNILTWHGHTIEKTKQFFKIIIIFIKENSMKATTTLTSIIIIKIKKPEIKPVSNKVGWLS